jgi:hypothetical protein
MHDVLDYPVYVKGLPERLQSTEPEPGLLDELSRRHADLADGYANHALEIDGLPDSGEMSIFAVSGL